MTEHDSLAYDRALSSAPRPMTAAFLRSPAYDLLMNRHVPAGGPGLHEAEERSASYVFRHATCASALGAWRWRGMQAMRERLCAVSGNIIDFGGAASPLGLGSLVVDRAERDAYGRDVHSTSMRGLRAPVVFTSHTLEHCEDLDGTLAEIREALMPGGYLIAHVPAWTCVRWRAGVHTSSDYGAHRWTFGLGESEPGLQNYTAIALAVAWVGLDVVSAAYCGDDSIMVVAKR